MFINNHPIKTVQLIVIILMTLLISMCCQVQSKSHQQVDTFIPGLSLSVSDDEVKIKIDTNSLEKDVSVGRKGSDGQKKPNIIQRIGGMLLMIPVMMQLLAMPGAIASMKVSLLRSLIMGKIALIIMFANLFLYFKDQTPKTVVVVQPPIQPPPQYYSHYYNPFQEDIFE